MSSSEVDPDFETGEADADGDGKLGSSLARMLSTLDLFSTSTPALTVDEIAVRLGVPKSTGYRYVQELCRVGLLVRLDKSITLGPRIIELDLCIRGCDPVMRAAIPLMRALSDQTGLDVSLSKLYGGSIVTVHMEMSDSKHAPYGYGRGRPLPLWRGAPSKALIAFLPAARLRRLHQDLAASATGGPTWELFYEEVQQIRKTGYCRTSGELNEGTTGIAAPVYGRGRLVAASVTLIGSTQRFTLFDPAAIGDLVIHTADGISARVSADAHL